MPDQPSKFAENQFESATRERFPLMSEVLSDTIGRLPPIITAKPTLSPALTALTSVAALWTAGETALANAEAALPSATALLEDKLASLARKPDLETNSILETWDNAIRGQVPYQGSIYTLLLPRGRETVTGGGIEDRIDALRDLGIRLGNQTTKPALVTLGTTVTAFATATRALRTTQLSAKGALDLARVNQEVLRLNAAAELYSMVGLGMTVFKTTPDQVDTLFSISLLRSPAQTTPAAPVDTSWNPTTRTLFTLALPDGATRLEAWREGPGGMPERLAVGERLATSVVIPANITFDAGDLYQLWLQARNAEGTSPAGPKVSWTAV